MERCLRGLHATLLLLIALISAPGLSRAAGEIVTVTLDADGPDKEMPLGTSFYLQGPVEADAKEVYVVVVRTSWPLLNLWSADQDRCSELQKLGAPPELEKVSRHALTRQLWPSDKDWWNEPALVLGPWRRKEGTTEQQYKLLIPSDSLFRQGASYCLLSYVKQSSKKSDVVNFRTRLLELGERVRHCIGNDESPAKQTTCTSTEATNLESALTADFKDLPAQAIKDAWLAIRGAKVKGSDGELTGLLDAALAFSIKSRKLTNTTGTWEAYATYGPDGTLYAVPTPPPPPPDPLPPGATPGQRAAWAVRAAAAAADLPKDESFGLPFVVADRLAAQGELGRLDPGYKFANSVVTRLGMKDDHTFLVEVNEATPGAAPAPALKSVAVPAASLLLPDSQLSLEDGLRFADGFIEIDGEYVAIRNLARGKLATLQPGADGNFSQQQIDDVAAVRAALEAWDTLLSSVDKANRTPGDERNAARALRAMVAHVPSAMFAELRRRVSSLTTLLQEYERSEKAWNAAPQVIREKTTITWQAVSYRVDRRTGLTQQRWFDTYFTPVVGRAMVFGRSANFGEWYTGLQFFAYANAINEPMWTNGCDDLRRLIGVELAAIPKTGSFGPNGRFSRDEDVGLAWMLGAVLQPLPYTTVSGGGVWISERESRLAAENPSAHFAWYVGLAVQANVPGIIRTLANPATATTNGAE
jgi:hypothetical protein